MNEFVASNGVKVWRNAASGRIRFMGDPVDLDNLREKLSGDHLGFSPAAEKALIEFVNYEANHKPWHDAKEGDVWVLELTNGQTHPAIFQADAFRDTGGAWTANEIANARKIWPEPS